MIFKWFVTFITFLFNLLSVSPETAIHLRPIEVNIVHNESTKNAIPPYRLIGHHLLFMSYHEKKLLTGTGASYGNQSHLGHNKKEVSSSLFAKEVWQFDGR